MSERESVRDGMRERAKLSLCKIDGFQISGSVHERENRGGGFYAAYYFLTILTSMHSF